MRTLIQKRAVVEFDSTATDPLFDALAALAKTDAADELCRRASITQNAASKILGAIRDNQVRSLAEVSSLQGLGGKSIDNLYTFLSQQTTSMQEVASRQPALL